MFTATISSKPSEMELGTDVFNIFSLCICTYQDCACQKLLRFIHAIVFLIPAKWKEVQSFLKWSPFVPLHVFVLIFLQYHKEVTRLVTGQHRAEVAPMLVNLARMWMKFVQAHYSHGKGSRPRWANAGLEFIVFVCNPHNTRYLSEQDFQVRDVEWRQSGDSLNGFWSYFWNLFLFYSFLPTVFFQRAVSVVTLSCFDFFHLVFALEFPPTM